MAEPRPAEKGPDLKHLLNIFALTRQGVKLVWSTSRSLALSFFGLYLLAGTTPVVLAYLSKLVIDSVVQAANTHSAADQQYALKLVAIETAVVVFSAALTRASAVAESLLRAKLGHRVNVMILEKALTLDLAHFEDSEFYDKMSQARQYASSRPFSLVMRSLSLLRYGVQLISYTGLLLRLSPWALLLLWAAGLPSFFVETYYSREGFRLFTWRSPEKREQAYLEMLLAREDSAKEVMLFGLGPIFLKRYDDIFRNVYAEDRTLTVKRAVAAFALGVLGTAALYGGYFWVVLETMRGRLSLGEMTMLFLVFKQGQDAITSCLAAVGGMYEDNLYINNLQEFLNAPVPPKPGRAVAGVRPGDGLRFENVSFAYPGQEGKALADVSFHLKPGEKLALVGENGSGKTTLVKLLARLYEPTEGRILLDGTDLREWDERALRSRIGVIFQDFVRYQLLVGENIGAGDVRHINDEERWAEAGRKGLAEGFVETMPDGYRTRLGRWFKGGRELSGGQWQKVALSRAFMRKEADILVLDEPTSAVDPKAEVQLFEHFQELTKDQMAILISHRFSTVRRANRILVLEGGHILEEGSHEELIKKDGLYARLFALQAAGYR